MAIEPGLAGLDARLVHITVVGLDDAVCLLDAALRGGPARRWPDQRRSGGRGAPGAAVRGVAASPAMKWPPANCGTAELIERGKPMADGATHNAMDVTTKISPRPVADTVARLTQLLAAKGMKLFDTIDQSAEARGVGLELRDTTLVIFGSPAAGTPVMAAAPMSALDLPLKILVWDDSGQRKVSYYAPAALAARHHLDADLAAKLAGIDPLTDALVAQ